MEWEEDKDIKSKDIIPEDNTTMNDLLNIDIILSCCHALGGSMILG